MSASKPHHSVINNKNWTRGGCIHFLPRDYHAYTGSFIRAADQLIQHIADNEKEQEKLLYPIAFLYAQHLKLQLQMINDLGQAYLRDSSSDLPDSSMITLWNDGKTIIRKAIPDCFASLEFDKTDVFIRQIAQLDLEAITIRCHKQKADTFSLAGAEYINLCNLAECAHSSSKFLDRVVSILTEFHSP